MVEYSDSENSSVIIVNEYFWNVEFNLQLDNDHRTSSVFDDNTLISSQFQVFTSLILCIMGSIGTLFHIGILIRRYIHTKSFSYHIFIQILFDSCHSMNILSTNLLFILKHQKMPIFVVRFQHFYFH